MAHTTRHSGVLLHPTSLPGRFGIGELGDAALHFADWLREHGQTRWQVLPLGPTGYGDSPYQTLSAFAGNPNLIHLEQLAMDGWLPWSELRSAPKFPDHKVDFGAVLPWRARLLEQAYQGFTANASAQERDEFAVWRESQADWLADYALFRALKDQFGGVSWVDWPREYALRHEEALVRARQQLAPAIDLCRFRQWLFHRQWHTLREACHQRDIRLIGDIPIFVAHDSSDVWARRELFALDENGCPTVVAGVPPDYFSATGQRWGNPLYRWEKLRADGYAWWLARLQATLALVDEVRIDHFRGFEAYWEIPASEPTAIIGEWRPGPGADFFQQIQSQLGALPIIAEDLGVITAEVEALRDEFELPGMKVLQFAWSDPQNPFLPHNYPSNCIAYAGTHDNNTTLGWWQHELDERARQFAAEFLRHEIREPHWSMIHCGMSSVARAFIATMPDLLGLGSEARMNTPGHEYGNWQWRLPPDYDRQLAGARLGRLTWLTRRHPEQQRAIYGDAAVN